MDKVINEFRVIETDDGFRIEIKGDKEAIRRWLKGLGPKGPFGRGFHFDFGPGGFWGGFGGCWGPWGEEEEGPKSA